jgi:histidinol-phosphatase
MPEHAKQNFLQTALDAARAAKEVTMFYYERKQTVNVEVKTDQSPVTVADREAERAIVETIKKRFPDHGVLAEEGGRNQNQSDYLWVIDPIDGTKTYARKVPFFATLIALMFQGEAECGVSLAPALGELMYAAKGGGAFLNDSPVSVSSIRDLSQATVGTADMRLFAERKLSSSLLDFLKHTYQHRIYGTFYNLHLLASGRSDVAISLDLKPWDLAALAVIVREAGGSLTSLKGEPLGDGASTLLATNGILHEKVLRHFNVKELQKIS